MADYKSHKAMADQCSKTLQYLLKEKEEHPEWICVVAFYRALHLVEVLFTHDNKSHGNNHESREKLLKHTKRYQQVYKHYRPLWDISTVASVCPE
ncbi:MAG: hypothetical protein KDA84_25985, partial [Planctomycetaceae bacterium]|nr:hypothetical protein [Planctomycetaceae bacterium]